MFKYVMSRVAANVLLTTMFVWIGLYFSGNSDTFAALALIVLPLCALVGSLLFSLVQYRTRYKDSWLITLAPFILILLFTLLG